MCNKMLQQKQCQSNRKQRKIEDMVKVWNFSFFHVFRNIAVLSTWTDVMILSTAFLSLQWIFPVVHACTICANMQNFYFRNTVHVLFCLWLFINR